MNDNQEGGPPTVAQLVGLNIRRLREAKGKVLRDVAEAARTFGVKWDASAVSRIETGRRDLTVEELLALPHVLTLALDEPVTLRDLLPDGEPMQVTSFDRKIPASRLQQLLAEPGLAWFNVRGHERVTEGVKEWLTEDKRKAQLQRGGVAGTESYEELQALADELGVGNGNLLLAYRDLWGEFTGSMAQERERRLLESGADLSQPTKVRTLRGHITRQLMAELRDYFDQQKGSDGPR
ncbi:helix-turn-helix transcriptional regulator [Nonomuraea sp. NPDC050202]|jgi:transcriptional regulator with XRE-family HTH domain|uniref:helix-turn-helix domain-containing protein n=1 Tax=Nonomuraea sp. NPDC050202 TaxID=3155035 RepID=UPI0033E1F361